MLRHPDGAPLVRLYGPTDDVDRGGTVAFNLLDRAGGIVDFWKVEASAADRRISVRTGCFCNPGASETARGLTVLEMDRVFALGRQPSIEDLRRLLPGRALGAVRVSVGIATTERDISRFVAFLQDQASDGAEPQTFKYTHVHSRAEIRDTEGPGGKLFVDEPFRDDELDPFPARPDDTFGSKFAEDPEDDLADRPDSVGESLLTHIGNEPTVRPLF